MAHRLAHQLGLSPVPHGEQTYKAWQDHGPVAQVAGRGSRSGCTGKRQADWQVVCRPLVLFSMLGATPRLRFEKLGKKDPRIGCLAHPESFACVRLRDLHALDKLFGMHTLVYSLGEDGKVELVHRPTDILSKQQSLAAFRLNFYGGHFSYVKHLAKIQ